MFAVHHALHSCFGAAEGLVNGAGTDPSKVDTVASFYDNVLEFLHVHHQGEDELVYPVIEERCPEHRALLERIDAQHRLLDEPMSLARQALTDWQSDPDEADGARFISLLAEIDTVLEPHLRQEENEVLPIASAFLSEEEWGELPGHAMATFGSDKPWLALGLVRASLPPEIQEAMLAGMPEPLQALWVNEWEPAFTRFIAEVEAIAPLA